MTGMSYIARTTAYTKQGKRPHPVGTVVFASVDIPERAASNANEIARLVELYYIIERVPVEWVRRHFLTTDRYPETQP